MQILCPETVMGSTDRLRNSWLMLDNSAADKPMPIAWRNVDGPVQIVKDGPWDQLRRQYEKDII
jgi:hypothetical protein